MDLVMGGQAATVREDTCHLQKIVQAFKEHNEELCTSVRVIIIDKDFTEFKVLKEEFPAVIILYCQWHVLKAMFKGLSDCAVEVSKRDRSRQLLRSLVFATTNCDYEKHLEQLCDCTNQTFVHYFMKN